MYTVPAVSYLHSGVNDTTVHITAASLTPLCKSKRCHWHNYACHSSVHDTAVQCVHVTEVSFTKQCQWHRCAVCSQFRFPNKKTDHLRKYSTKVVAQRWSLAPLWDAIDTTVQPTLPTFSANSKPYSKRFYMCIRGLEGDVWWKRPEVENLA
jgi:hypothetical protein